MTESRPAVLPLLVISTVFLALEVLVTRILAYSLHAILLYIVLGVAMLGSGAAGSLVALRSGWIRRDRIDASLAWAAVAACLTIPLSLGLFVRLTPVLYPGSPLSFVIAGVLTLPFMAAAVVVTLVLASADRHIGRCYAANLVGSGIGCFLPAALLGPLDGEQMLGLLTLLSWTSALLYVRRVAAPKRGALSVACGIALASSLASLMFAHAWFPIQPDPSDQVGDIVRWTAERNIETEKKFDRWNATGRVQLFGFQMPGATESYPILFYAQDSGAGSMLAKWDGKEGGRRGVVPWMCSNWLYAQGYYEPRPKVMIIGLGGGPDLQCALYHGAESVDSVEINPDSIRVVEHDFSDWLGLDGARNRIRFHNRDGRSFAHSSRGADFDLIQMSGADTKHALASGGLALSENHLYTREAFVDYLESLAPDGLLSVIRFGEIDTLRLANTAGAALRELGVSEPHRHIAVLQHGALGGLLVRRAPFSRDQIMALGRHMRVPPGPGLSIFFYEGFELESNAPTILYVPGAEAVGDVGALFRAMETGSTDAFAAGYRSDISPTDDDRPFFFNFHRLDDPATWLSAPHIVTIRNLMISVLALSVALILLPLFGMRERLRGWHVLTVPLYFASVGLAYMWVEVWMIHRFSMFLGHQTYGLTVVLASLLIGTGAGAHFSHRLWEAAPERRARLGVAVIGALLAAGFVGLPALIEAAWNAPLWLRALTTMAFTVPTGFAMGMPFPAGLAWLSRHQPGAMAWCVGINGFASVIATVAVIPLSMGLGYSSVLGWGIALYITAALMTLSMTRTRTA